jgi:hypothetical protein
MIRRAAAIALSAVLVATAVFYLLAPTVYAYVSEVYMSYAYVPKWFAATPPARMAATLFDGYNAGGPREATFRRRLACYLVDGGSRTLGDCSHEIPAGAGVSGPPDFKLSAGLYVASLEFGETDRCGSGTVRLGIVDAGRFGRTLTSYEGRIDPGKRIVLPIRVAIMDAALDVVDVRLSVSDGCVVLKTVELREYRGRRP